MSRCLIPDTYTKYYILLSTSLHHCRWVHILWLLLRQFKMLPQVPPSCLIAVKDSVSQWAAYPVITHSFLFLSLKSRKNKKLGRMQGMMINKHSLKAELELKFQITFHLLSCLPSTKSLNLLRIKGPVSPLLRFRKSFIIRCSSISHVIGPNCDLVTTYDNFFRSGNHQSLRLPPVLGPTMKGPGVPLS